VSVAAEVARVARLLAAAGLVEAFGHVSARCAGGFVLTSTGPLLAATAESTLEFDADGNVIAGERCPLEAPLHAAIYAARPDVGAICRTHSPFAAAWASRREPLPLIHGLGGLSGEVALYESPQLVTGAEAAARAAAALDHGDCLLLRGNGAACTGSDLPQAAVRAWFLEERAAFAARCEHGRPLEAGELEPRSRHYAAETARAWSWLQARYGS
jgi:ribulose-5-phosphate 4-epimerase/fuculose-1-phosphate aldolase